MSQKFTKKEFRDASRLVGEYSAYSYAINNTQEYVASVNTFDVIQSKFHKKINSAEKIKNWVQARKDDEELLRCFLVGHSGGEVKAANTINGSLKGLLYKADFERTEDGIISNNSPYDLLIKNRFTEETVQRVQVKSYWSEDTVAGNTRELKKYLSKIPNEHHDSLLVAGPEEYIKSVNEQDIPVNTIEVGNLSDNKELYNNLKESVENSDPALMGELTLDGVGETMIEGGLTCGAVSLGINSIMLGLNFLNGDISASFFKEKIMTESSISLTSGTLLSGASIMFPPGMLGLGIGIALSVPLRRLVKSAYGEGAYKQILMGSYYNKHTVETTINGVKIVYQSNSIRRKRNNNTAQNLRDFSESSRDVDQTLNRIDDLND